MRVAIYARVSTANNGQDPTLWLMGDGVGTIYRAAQDGSKIPQKVF
jgi:hypothetical protein